MEDEADRIKDEAKTGHGGVNYNIKISPPRKEAFLVI
jgi:hypothetical protein